MAAVNNGLSFDELLEKLGALGRYQVLTIVLVGITVIAVGSHCLGTVFLAGMPEFHCISGENSRSLSQYGLDAGNGTLLRREVVNSCAVVVDNLTLDCEAWSYEEDVFSSTIVTQWDLVCAEQWKGPLAQSLFMVGGLCGSVIGGRLADLFGRKRVFFCSLVAMVVTGSAAAYMPLYWLFVAGRMLQGVSTFGLFTSGFVLTMEVLAVRHRVFFGIFFQAWFALGYMMLAGLAYFIRDYRTLQIVSALCRPCAYRSGCNVLDESPRWLLMEGGTKAAFTVIAKMAAINRKSIMFQDEHEMATLVTCKDAKTEEEKQNQATFIDLMRKPLLCRNTLITWYQWFIISMTYYGLSLGVSVLTGGVHLNLFLSGLIEFPGFFIAFFLMYRFGRRATLLLCNLVGGLACAAMGVIPNEYGIAITCASLVGKCVSSGLFALIYVYSAELFPTVVRTVVVGSGSMCARVAGFLAPFIVLTSALWAPLPSFIFAALSLAGSGLALFLPETLNQPLPDTLQDAENVARGKRDDWHQQSFTSQTSVRI